MEAAMAIDADTPTVENPSLVADLVEWIARQPRPYVEVMEAWRTSCPRFPIWEDVVDLRFVARVNEEGPGEMIHVTSAGRAFLRAHGRKCEP
jgi:hypothetical protein